LAAVADPAAVPDAVAAVLGITQQPGKSVSESVASALEGRSRLSVFDNCEHVVDSVADLVEAILAATDTVKVLATSREGIGVADEPFWRVPSLDVGAAVELFVERAQSMVSDTVANEATAVEDVCRRLDGIPLAIELAASRMASMTAAEVRDRLDDRFKLLVGSRRGLERHQTLRHAVAWSYDLLDDAEKTVLERCSVFRRGIRPQERPSSRTNRTISSPAPVGGGLRRRSQASMEVSPRRRHIDSRQRMVSVSLDQVFDISVCHPSCATDAIR
jgi:predicted ATPase